MERPAKELKGFERVMLEPGQTKQVSMKLDPRSFSFFDVKSGAWHADAGDYELLLGDSSANITQKTTVQLPQPINTPVGE